MEAHGDEAEERPVDRSNTTEALQPRIKDGAPDGSAAHNNAADNEIPDNEPAAWTLVPSTLRR